MPAKLKTFLGSRKLWASVAAITFLYIATFVVPDLRQLPVTETQVADFVHRVVNVILAYVGTTAAEDVAQSIGRGLAARKA